MEGVEDIQPVPDNDTNLPHQFLSEVSTSDVLTHNVHEELNEDKPLTSSDSGSSIPLVIDSGDEIDNIKPEINPEMAPSQSDAEKSDTLNIFKKTKCEEAKAENTQPTDSSNFHECLLDNKVCFKCGTCNYTTAVKQSMIVHIRKHTGEKPFKCEVCDYECSYKCNLTSHMRTHTGEKPYICTICGFKGARKGTLDRHIATHNREKIFKCKSCNYSCARKDNLLRHERYHKD